LKKKILITGSNGLLGQHLLHLLLPNNAYEVYGSGLGNNRFPDLSNTQYFTLDITDGVAINNLLHQIKPHFVIHTAAKTHVDDCELDPIDCYKKNVLAVQFLAEATKQVQAKLIHLSTDFIFDGTKGPYDELAAANPLSIYGSSKLQAEKVIVSCGVQYAIARTVLVYGQVHDQSRNNIITWVKGQLEQNLPIKLVNDQLRSPTFAGDLAKGCILLIEKDASGIFNIAGKDLMTPYDMGLATAKYFNLNPSLIAQVDGSIFKQPAARPPKTGLLISKAQQQLAYNPLSFAEGIASMNNFFKS
jgi:dTDP-4-dehydrorhamnose reductase